MWPWSATPPADRTRWPASSASSLASRRCGAAPTTRTPWSGSSSRTPTSSSSSPRWPTPSPGRGSIDRCLVAAYDAGLDPLLVLTKADLVEPDAFLAAYATLAVPYVVTRRDPTDPARHRRDRGGPRAPVRPRVRAHRSLRGRQVDAGEPAGPRRRTGGRGGQHRDRPGPAHLDVVGGAPAARRRRLGHRHGRHPVVRTRPRGDRRGSSPSSPTSNPGPPSARAAARTTRRSARSTPTSPPAPPARRASHGSTRCAGCCARVSARTSERTGEPTSLGCRHPG